MKLIGVETSAEACSAAFWIDGEVMERFQLAPRGHSELILKMVDEVLAEGGVTRNDLDGVAFGRGPGSFTGVRIATGVAQGMAFGLDVPAIPVSTLEILAQGIHRKYGYDYVLAAFDARMGEVYWGPCAVNANGLMALVDEEIVCVPEMTRPMEAVDRDWHGAGSGWRTYSEVLGARHSRYLAAVIEEAHCHALDAVTLGAARLEAGRGVAAANALPVYLRNQVAWKKPGG